LRSRAAASVLEGEGFSKVYNMDGGIRAWEGIMAGGAPEAGMAYFETSVRLDELIGLAWKLEDGSRKFYTLLSGFMDDADARQLFEELTRAEEGHKLALIRLFTEVTGSKPDDLFPQSVLSADMTDDVMEGGIFLEKAWKWAQGKDVQAIIEFSITLETNAYDLYIKMARAHENDQSQKIFDMLALDEQKHLAKLAALLEEKL
jgi:rubrerythrin